MTKTESIIETMLERLWLAKRDLQSSYFGDKEPSFVLVCHNAAHRHRLEGIILGYLADKYGFHPGETARHYDMNPGQCQTTFSFPEHGYRITLIDLKV